MTSAAGRPALVLALGLALGAAAPAAASPWAIPDEGSCTPSDGLRGWPIGEDAAPIVFEPGDVIDIGASPVLRSYLPPEIWEYRDRFFFEGMQLEIGPCFRDYSAPAFFSAATKRFAGRAQLLPNGGIESTTAGLPFAPDTIAADDPDAGQKWAWNTQLRYRAGGFRGDFRVSDLVGRTGRAEPFEGEIFHSQLAHRADRADDDYRVPDTEFLWVAGGRFTEPFNAREYAWLQYRAPETQTESGRSDDLHIYVPDMRKVRRSPAAGVEGLYMPSFAVGVRVLGTSAAVGLASLGSVGAQAVPDSIETRRSGFEGLELRPLLYRFAVLGVQDILAPINAALPAYPENPDRSFGPWGLSWATDRWDLRRTLVLDGVARGQDDPDREVGRLRMWVDLQTGVPLYYSSYDKRGQLIDVGLFVGRWSEDRAGYPRWPDDPEREVRIIDPVGAAFANLKLRGSWRRESWNVVSIPQSDTAERRSLSLRNLQKGR